MSSCPLVEDKEHPSVNLNVVKSNVCLPQLRFLKLLLEAIGTVHSSATTLKPLAGEQSIIDHLSTMAVIT